MLSGLEHAESLLEEFMEWTSGCCWAGWLEKMGSFSVELDSPLSFNGRESRR